VPVTHLCRVAALLIALVSPAVTQVGGPQSRFEVVSIKVSGPKSVRGSEGGPGSKDPGRFTYGRCEILSLILNAYQVDTFQVQSRIALDRDAFDIVAKVPEGATKEDLRAMLRNLLADRFNLKVRVEQRDSDSAVIVVAPTGLKMASSGAKETLGTPKQTSACEFPVLPAGKPGFSSRLTTVHDLPVTCSAAQQQSVADLSRNLRQYNGMPVVDGTGIKDKFDFTLAYSTELAASIDADPIDVRDLAHALTQQLGLQIVKRKTPITFVVVESVDRLPTEN